MVSIRSKTEVEKLAVAGKIVHEVLEILKNSVKPGITTGELDNIAERHIKSCGAIASFKGYNGFPKSACISINEELIHGIPSDRKLLEGDIVSVDVGACYQGYHGDAARTFGVGKISDEAQRLIDVTRQSFFEGLLYMKEGYRINDISGAIQDYVEGNGFSIVREYCGHGVGAKLHESPEIPNYVAKRQSMRLVAGMVIAVEPMVNAGSREIYVADDNWTVISCDKSLTAHYENTVLITHGEPRILTCG